MKSGDEGLRWSQLSLNTNGCGWVSLACLRGVERLGHAVTWQYSPPPSFKRVTDVTFLMLTFCMSFILLKPRDIYLNSIARQISIVVLQILVPITFQILQSTHCRSQRHSPRNYRASRVLSLFTNDRTCFTTSFRLRPKCQRRRPTWCIRPCILRGKQRKGWTAAGR